MVDDFTSDVMRWNKRFSRDDYIFGKDPNGFLIERANIFQAGKKVLCIGAGEGRNAVFLATLGMEVTCVDFSRIALEKAEKLAAESRVEINTLCVDVNRWVWPAGAFDYVIWVFLHVSSDNKARLHRNICACLKDNGMLVGQVFQKNQLEFASGGPKDDGWLYDMDEIEDSFFDMKPLLLEERLLDLKEGPDHQGKGVVVEFVLQKKIQRW